METKGELQPTLKVKDEQYDEELTTESTLKPSLSFIIAKTIINNPDGITTRDISTHIKQTYPRFRSVDLNVFVKSVGSDISRSEFYYKKSKRSKNTHLWAVHPKYKSRLEEMTAGTYRPFWNKDLHKSKTRKRKSKPNVINYCAANSLEHCEGIKTEEPDGEYNPMSSDEASISQLNDEMNIPDIYDLMNYLQLQFNSQEQDSSAMYINEQENPDVQSENSNHYMNQNYSEQTTDAFTSANTNNIDLTTMQDDHPSNLEEIKFINIPMNTISENINTPMNTSETHSVDNQTEMLFCPMCELPFFTYEDLGKHVHFKHTGDGMSSNINQNGALKEVLSYLMTDFKNLKSNTPIELYIVTGNENVHMTADPEKQRRTFS